MPTQNGKRKRERVKEFDFSRAVPNKFARRFWKDSNVVVIEPDLAKIFPNSDAVNTALRALTNAFAKSRRKAA